MKLKELNDNKALLEELIADDRVPDDEKKIYKESLSNLNEQIEAATKAEDANRSQSSTTASQAEPKSKKMLKKDFYAKMDTKFPDAKYNELKNLPQSEYDGKMKKFGDYAKDLGAPKDYTLSWIERHIPKGKSRESEKVEKLSHSWKTPSPASEMNPFVLHCQQYYQLVEKSMRLKLKGTGDESIDVIAKKGEYLVFDDNRQLVFVMTGKDFKRKCIEHTTIEDHYQADHKTEEFEIVQKENQELKSRIEHYNRLAQKSTSSNDNGDKGSDEKTNQKPKASKPKRKPVCTLKEAEIGRRVQKITKFFVDHAEKWKNNQTTRKITKIYRTRGEKQEIIVEMADYRGFVTGLQTMIGGKRKYYRLCVDSFNLTATSKPRQGSYTLVIKEADMKRVYTTKGDKRYAICLKTYRVLLKCSFEGTCTSAQSKKWKSLHQECGDLIIKLEKQPEIMRNFHAEVKTRRRKGEPYNQAAERTAKELKLEAKK